MTGAKVWFRGLFQRTVWSHYNLAHVPQRYKAIYTTVLPIMYCGVLLYGSASVAVPINSIDLVLGFLYGDIWSIGLLVTGTLALIGVCFYAWLIWVEVVADVALATLMGFYVACIFVAGGTGAEAFRFLSLLLVIIIMAVPGWRILDIIRELRPPRES